MCGVSCSKSGGRFFTLATLPNVLLLLTTLCLRPYYAWQTLFFCRAGRVTCEKLVTKQNREVDSQLVVTYVTPTQDNNEAISGNVAVKFNFFSVLHIFGFLVLYRSRKKIFLDFSSFTGVMNSLVPRPCAERG